MGKWRDSKPSQMDSQRALLGKLDGTISSRAAFYIVIFFNSCRETV